MADQVLVTDPIDFVAGLYEHICKPILGQEEDPNGFHFWLDHLLQTKDPARVASDFAGSVYAAKATQDQKAGSTPASPGN
jgi:hypothetical protein